MNNLKSLGIDIFDNKISDKNKIKFLELYGSPTHNYHKYIYDLAEQRILMKYEKK